MTHATHVTRSYTPAKPLISVSHGNSLQVEVWMAFINLTVLRSIKKQDIFWGWVVENGERIREGIVECLLLSTGCYCTF
jgi:hypothetical protein